VLEEWRWGGREGGRGRKGVYRWMCDRGMGWGNALVVAVENDGGEWSRGRAKRVWAIQPYENVLVCMWPRAFQFPSNLPAFISLATCHDLSRLVMTAQGIF